MKHHKHLGIYGIIIKGNKILLIDKKGGPYDGKLDLPGGSMEFGETPEETLKREILEETGLEIKKYELFNANSVLVDWYRENETIKVHHTGIFYKILDYKNEIKNIIEIDKQNDDSLGANFHNIDELKKEELSEITLLMLEKIGYILN